MTLEVALELIVIFLYGSCALISLIFTFSLPAYRALEEKLDFELAPAIALTPLEQDIDVFDAFLAKFHGVIGPVLFIGCIVNLKLSFGLIKLICCN